MFTALSLLITSVLLVIAERVGTRSRELPGMNAKDSLIVGFFSGAVDTSGISRSGSTITGEWFVTSSANLPRASPS